MQGTSLDKDLMRVWEESLQALFQSLLKDMENPQQAKKSEDLDAFMAKWVEGVQTIFALEANTLGKGESQDRLSSQDMNLPASEKSLGHRGKSRSPKKLKFLTTLKQAESETVLRMIEKISRDSQRSKTEAAVPWLSLSLAGKTEKGAANAPYPGKTKGPVPGND